MSKVIQNENEEAKRVPNSICDFCDQKKSVKILTDDVEICDTCATKPVRIKLEYK